MPDVCETAQGVFLSLIQLPMLEDLPHMELIGLFRGKPENEAISSGFLRILVSMSPDTLLR